VNPSAGTDHSASNSLSMASFERDHLSPPGTFHREVAESRPKITCDVNSDSETQDNVEKRLEHRNKIEGGPSGRPPGTDSMQD